ncbi:hypothetical protein JAAARDRAFT_29400 [Jaapia argillacea MUCL 33604]|uniref:AB hydrolase-1 domain-containing protein n=1 Tax=Jaapia argillacea MUCL 33604 TaxID=933084 RepID=A0A067Q8Q7_9AGAM|nr:hypothetical protein JAAARDRAFT_29400 [Jaapia argillacea MUCL 33604]
MGEQIPPFLKPLDDIVDRDEGLPYISTVLHHTKPLGAAHTLWWPFTMPRSSESSATVILFIPGNPGLLGFYPPFLSDIHARARSSSTPLAILAHSHIGHSPGVEDTETRYTLDSVGLTAQVASAIEAVDLIKDTFGNNTKIVVIGHSVGSWITLKVLKSRPEDVTEVFLLFPTISQIASTPNGHRLSWVFRSPFPRIISRLSPVARILPTTLLSLLFRGWPLPQLHVLKSLINSPMTIFSALTMAHDEMKTIRELDVALLDEYRHRICMYFAEDDDWVGEQREAILAAFQADPGTVRIVHGHPDIPHAFCINHGEPLASQCFEWLIEAGLL